MYLASHLPPLNSPPPHAGFLTFSLLFPSSPLLPHLTSAPRICCLRMIALGCLSQLCRVVVCFLLSLTRRPWHSNTGGDRPTRNPPRDLCVSPNLCATPFDAAALRVLLRRQCRCCPASSVKLWLIGVHWSGGKSSQKRSTLQVRAEIGGNEATSVKALCGTEFSKLAAQLWIWHGAKFPVDGIQRRA